MHIAWRRNILLQQLKHYRFIDRLPEFEYKKMNAEVSSGTSKRSKTRDTHLVEIQKLAGSSLMALGSALTSILNKDCDEYTLVQQLNDAAKLNLQLHYSISLSRKANAFVPNLSPEIIEVLKTSEMAEMLYGKNLNERIKEARGLTKLTKEIKKPTPKPPTQSTAFLGQNTPYRRPTQNQDYNKNKGQQDNRPYSSKQSFFNNKNKSSSKLSRSKYPQKRERK